MTPLHPFDITCQVSIFVHKYGDVYTKTNLSNFSRNAVYNLEAWCHFLYSSLYYYLFVSTETLDSMVQKSSVSLKSWVKHGYDDIFKMPSQFFLEVLHKILYRTKAFHHPFKANHEMHLLDRISACIPLRWLPAASSCDLRPPWWLPFHLFLWFHEIYLYKI